MFSQISLTPDLLQKFWEKGAAYVLLFTVYVIGQPKKILTLETRPFLISLVTMTEFHPLLPIQYQTEK